MTYLLISQTYCYYTKCNQSMIYKKGEGLKKIKDKTKNGGIQKRGNVDCEGAMEVWTLALAMPLTDRHRLICPVISL